MGLRKETTEPFAAMTEKRLKIATRVIVREAKLRGELFLLVPGMI